MNLYRGCSHGCIYCDSRSSCYQMPHAFEDIEVKQNALVLLEEALRRKRKKCMIGTGSMTDPYIPLETELGSVRQAMELVYKYGCGFTVLTYDEELCKKIEPYVSTTRERFEALKQLRDAGIPTVVWLAPILPFINDTEANLRGILDYCIEAGVYGIICFGMGLTLRDGNREYFYQQLDRHFPGLKKRYIDTYGNQYVIDSPNSKQLMQLLRQKCRQHGIIQDNQQLFAYLSTFTSNQADLQQSLFLTPACHFYLLQSKLGFKMLQA